ncbi:YhgE/Pip domain-containing protein [Agromyces aerolatus]|uniref:YhgE/Pip domain-containing protein n=1 Tax=Agromyces sp. LY-1074 TaxID=3074080 RepID=UPI0028556EDB|nr:MULTISPECIES: YhgE/Pip domain-containing protein [unclassified Agromyces]MDR5700840.1 YhgE/Pip domain-containing protein [Agromyces sp. LY-1074]MDR5707361.1 YhgE/Pip domain-containing protein [Agromyces sp. LY-1358]
MGNIWRVFVRDLKRLGRVPLAWVIIGGALITPSLYAWFNISAFWDPFDNTKNLSIAVVNLDEGASTSLTGDVNVGDQLVAQLKDNDDLGWHFLSEAEAMDSIKSGESYAAFVVPATFSQDLLSLTSGDFTQPKLEYYVNEKLNGVAPEITDTGATTVQTQMTDAFTEQVADAVATAIQSGGSAIEQDLLDTEASFVADLERAMQVVGEARAQLGVLQTDLTAAGEGLRVDVSTLGTIDVALADTQVTLGDAQNLTDRAQADLLRLAGEGSTGHVIGSAEVAEAAAAALAGIGQVSAATSSLSAAVDAQRSLLAGAEGLLGGFDQQLAQTVTALVSLDNGLATLESDLSVAVTDLRSLGGAALWQGLESLTSLNAEQIGQFMSTPVEVEQHTIFPTATYGSQMAALFINLSLWIGAFVLVVILRLNVDREDIPNLTERQGYLGRWLLFAMIAVAQAITLSIGNLIIGVQHVNAFVFTLTPILIGLSYLSIIYALSVTFGYIGKGLVVILVIMQIPGASGIYPIQLMPEFFQSLYPWFPFTYGIDAMREVISGFAGLAYWRYIGMLLLFVAVAFFIGLVLRPHVANLTRLFTQEVADTELFTAESGAPAGAGYRLGHVLRALANRASYQRRLAKRALPFARSYKRVRTAIIAVGGAGILVIAALAIIYPDHKTEFVGSWILWLVAVFAALVVLEYIRYSLRLSTEVGDMPDKELHRQLQQLEADR